MYLMLANGRDARNRGELATVGVPRAARVLAASGARVDNWSNVDRRWVVVDWHQPALSPREAAAVGASVRVENGEMALDRVLGRA